jgi:NADH:ubiquinone oxidoreductase subunit 3 (subunit A)
MPSMVHDLFGCVIIQSWPFNLSYLAITILVLTDLDTLYLFNLAFEQFSCNNISVLLTFTLFIPLFFPVVLHGSLRSSLKLLKH